MPTSRPPSRPEAFSPGTPIESPKPPSIEIPSVGFEELPAPLGETSARGRGEVTDAQIAETMLAPSSQSDSPPTFLSSPHPPRITPPASIAEDNARDTGVTLPFPRSLLPSGNEITEVEDSGPRIELAVPYAAAPGPVEVVKDPEVAGVPASNHRQQRGRCQIM